MSISLASPDGRVVGGMLAGLLIAASPVQVNHLLRGSIPTLTSLAFLSELYFYCLHAFLNIAK